jgi:hypothetical protein
MLRISHMEVPMLNLFLVSVILTAGLDDPGEVLPAFRDSLMAGNTQALVGMVSSSALDDIDSVLAYHPENVGMVLALFGVPMEVPDLEETDAAELVRQIFASESFRAAVMIMGVEPGDPILREFGTFVPVSYGIFGNRDTIYVQLVEEEGSWKIRDFFDSAP